MTSWERPTAKTGTMSFPPGEDLVRERAEILGGLLTARLHVAVAPVGRLEDEGLEAGESIGRRVEQPAPLELDVPGVGEVVVALPEVEVADRRAEDVARVVHGEADVRRDIGRLAPPERDRPRDEVPDVPRVVEGLPRLLVDDLDGVEEHERHQVARRRGAVDRPLVPVLQQHGDEAAVVEVGVGDDHRVERVERKKLGRVEERGPVRPGVDPAVDEDLRVLGGEQVGAPPYLAVAAERRAAGPELLRERVARDPDPDLLQERPPVVEGVPEVDPYLFDGLRGDRGRADDGGHPADLLLEVVQDRAPTANRRPGARRLDRHLARFGLEEELGDLGLHWDERADRLLGLLGVDEGRRVGTDDHPAVQALSDLAQVVAPGEERVELLRVDHDMRAFQLDVGDLDGFRQHFAKRFPGLLYERFETHPSMNGKGWRRKGSEGRPGPSFLTEEQEAAVS